MQKSGVSDVVATVIIIALVIVAITVVWLGVMPLIKDKIGGSDVCNDVDVSVESSQGYTCWDKNQSIVAVQLHKGSNEVNVSGFKFYLSSGGNSVSYSNDTNLQKNSYTIFYLNTSGISVLDKLEVVPVASSGKSLKDCSKIGFDGLKDCNLGVVSASYSDEAPKPFGSNCVSGSYCLSGYCVNSKCTNENGISDESFCVNNGECLSGYCSDVGYCLRRVLGSNCYSGLDCDSGFCGYGEDYFSRVCMIGENGVFCDDSSSCLSGSCAWGVANSWNWQQNQPKDVCCDNNKSSYGGQFSFCCDGVSNVCQIGGETFQEAQSGNYFNYNCCADPTDVCAWGVTVDSESSWWLPPACCSPDFVDDGNLCCETPERINDCNTIEDGIDNFVCCGVGGRPGGSCNVAGNACQA